MYLNIMRYRTGKFGIQVTEVNAQKRVINNSKDIKEMRMGLSVSCSAYHISDNTDKGVVHTWTYDTWKDLSDAIATVRFSKVINTEDSPEDSKEEVK